MSWKLYTGYLCKHCKQGFVIVKSQGRFEVTYLPINYKIGDEIPDYFDKQLHRSHLLDCPKLAEQWGLV